MSNVPKIAKKLFTRRPGPKPGPLRPLMLGVVGDSGCGKSTFVRGLHYLFGKNNVTEICLDDYHKYNREERTALGLTALNPAVNDLELMHEHLTLLREGRRLRKPVYDHATGKFANPENITPRNIVIVHGLFTFFTPDLADLFDLRLFLQPQETLRVEWKVARDTGKRGYSVEEVVQQIQQRRPDALAYIHPQKEAADLTVNFRRPVSLLGTSELDVRLAPCRRWEWPHLQPEGSSRWLVVPPGGALEISGQIDLPTAERVARAFAAGWPPTAPHLLNPAQPLKGLGLYQPSAARRLLSGREQQSLPLALTQLLVAGRLLEAGYGQTGRAAA